MARRMFARAGHPGRILATSDLARGRRGRGCRADPAAGRRPGRPARRRDVAARGATASGRRRPGPAASRRRCARCRSCCGSPTRCASTPQPDAWIVDFTNPVGIVTRALLQAGHRAVGLCNVAIGFQRRFAALLGVDPDDVALGHVGLNHLTWERSVDDRRPRHACPSCCATASASSPTRSSCAPALLAHARRRAVVLPALLLRARRVLAEQLREPSRAEAVRAVENELLDALRRPVGRHEARGARAARRRLLLRGRGRAARRAPRRPRRRAGGEPAQRRRAAVPARRPRDRGAGAVRRDRASSPMPVDAAG